MKVNANQIKLLRRSFILGLSTLVVGWFAKGVFDKPAKKIGGSMLRVRKSNERGFADHGWLKSHHSFSFADYYDPQHMGFRSLRVINEDLIKSGTGFGSHPHNNMEIITYVVQGALQHKDSMGTTAVINPGEVQHMSAGTGVVHSEYSVGKDQYTHLLQIWIVPNSRGGNPSYGQKSFESDLNSKKLVLVVSNDGRDGSIRIKQDADLYISRLKAGDNLEYVIRKGRGVWVQVVSGRLDINGVEINAGDAVSLEEESLLKIMASEKSELIFFDLA